MSGSDPSPSIGGQPSAVTEDEPDRSPGAEVTRSSLARVELVTKLEPRHRSAITEVNPSSALAIHEVNPSSALAITEINPSSALAIDPPSAPAVEPLPVIPITSVAHRVAEVDPGTAGRPISPTKRTMQGGAIPPPSDEPPKRSAPAPRAGKRTIVGLAPAPRLAADSDAAAIAAAVRAAEHARDRAEARAEAERALSDESARRELPTTEFEAIGVEVAPESVPPPRDEPGGSRTPEIDPPTSSSLSAIDEHAPSPPPAKLSAPRAAPAEPGAPPALQAMSPPPVAFDDALDDEAGGAPADGLVAPKSSAWRWLVPTAVLVAGAGASVWLYAFGGAEQLGLSAPRATSHGSTAIDEAAEASPSQASGTSAPADPIAGSRASADPNSPHPTEPTERSVTTASAPPVAALPTVPNAPPVPSEPTDPSATASAAPTAAPPSDPNAPATTGSSAPSATPIVASPADPGAPPLADPLGAAPSDPAGPSVVPATPPEPAVEQEREPRRRGRSRRARRGRAGRRSRARTPPVQPAAPATRPTPTARDTPTTPAIPSRRAAVTDPGF